MFNLEDFSNKEEIFRSSAGAVFKAVYKKAGRTVVLKERRTAETGSKGDIRREVEILQRLRHPNIIKCYGFFFGPSKTPLYIVLQYAEKGDLYHIIQDRSKGKKPFREEAIWSVFHQISSAVAYAHSQGVIHRDLKTHNIFVMADNVVKVGDFGVGRVKSADTVMLTTFFGTPLYLSPELCENRPYNEKTDVWALGVILYELASLRTPFTGQSLMELVRNICKCKYSPVPATYSAKVGKAVDAMLQFDFNKRPSAASVMALIGPKADADPPSAAAARSDPPAPPLPLPLPEPEARTQPRASQAAPVSRPSSAQRLPHADAPRPPAAAAASGVEREQRRAVAAGSAEAERRPAPGIGGGRASDCSARSGDTGIPDSGRSDESMVSRQERLAQRAEEYRQRQARVQGSSGRDFAPLGETPHVSGTSTPNSAVYSAFGAPHARGEDRALRVSSDTDSAILQRHITEWNLSNVSALESLKRTGSGRHRQSGSAQQNAVAFAYKES